MSSGGATLYFDDVSFSEIRGAMNWIPDFLQKFEPSDLILPEDGEARYWCQFTINTDETRTAICWLGFDFHRRGYKTDTDVIYFHGTIQLLNSSGTQNVREVKYRQLCYAGTVDEIIDVYGQWIQIFSCTLKPGDNTIRLKAKRLAWGGPNRTLTLDNRYLYIIAGKEYL